MTFTTAELSLMRFLLRVESKNLSFWYDSNSPHSREDFRQALLDLSDKIADIEFHQKGHIQTVETNVAIAALIEAHKKKQLVLSTPASIGPEIT